MGKESIGQCLQVMLKEKQRSTRQSKKDAVHCIWMCERSCFLGELHECSVLGMVITKKMESM